MKKLISTMLAAAIAITALPLMPLRTYADDPPEIIEYTPQEMGLRRVDDPTRWGRQRALPDYDQLGNLPLGTVVNIPITEAGYDWMLPAIIVNRNHQQYGQGTILKVRKSVAVVVNGVEANNVSSSINSLQAKVRTDIKNKLITIQEYYISSYGFTDMYGSSMQTRAKAMQFFVPSVHELYGAVGVDSYGWVGWANRAPEHIKAIGSGYVTDWKGYTHSSEDYTMYTTIRQDGTRSAFNARTYTGSDPHPSRNSSSVEPYFVLPNNLVVSTVLDIDGGMDIMINNPPGSPPSMTIEGVPSAGGDLPLSCYPAIDPDGDNVTYRWQYSANGGTSWQEIGTSTDAQTVHTLPQTILTYMARVQAVDVYGEPSGWTTGIDGSGNKQISVNQPPTKPTGVSHAINYPSGTIDITWLPSTDPEGDAITYILEACVSGDAADYRQVYSGATPAAAVSIPTTGTAMYYRVQAADVKGAKSAYYYGTVGDPAGGAGAIDRLPPLGNFVLNTSDWTNQDVLLTLTAVDVGAAGIKRIRPQGGAWSNTDMIAVTIAENGIYPYEIEDNAGNLTSLSYTIGNVDKIPPTLSYSFATLSSPLLRGAFSTQVQLLVNAIDTLSGIATVEYQLVPEGGSLDPLGWIAYNSSSPPRLERAFTGNVYVRATDNAGNIAIKYDGLTLEDTPPTLSHTLTPSAITKNDVVIALTAVDTGGIDSITLPDGSVISGTDTVSYTVAANGTYAFRAEDLSGNITNYSVVVANIDKLRPVITEIDIKAYDDDDKYAFKVTVRATDDTKVDKIYYAIAPKVDTWIAVGSGGIIRLSKSAAGKDMFFKATDVVGNESEEEWRILEGDGNNQENGAEVVSLLIDLSKNSVVASHVSKPSTSVNVPNQYSNPSTGR